MSLGRKDDVHVTLVDRHPPLKRVVLGFVGAVCIALPAWELRHAFVQIGWWTLPFTAIVLGAWAVGGVMIAAAVAGDSTTWVLQDDALVITRRSPFRLRVDVIRRADVAQVHVDVSTWDSGPDTYRVVLELKTGARFTSPSVSTREEAAELAERVNGSVPPA